ncbi:N-acetylglucosamine-6-phosphate deacetylase [Eubacterium sp.]|uniref:N-acetylglucosamine-6-phosphate deacetylase n=1 Tax=Eubacterium sp. TaxID=142586 RepID=UPI002FC99647
MYIENVKIVYPDTIMDGTLQIENQCITGINMRIPDSAPRLNGEGLYLSPGFIDTHIHGAGGHDTMEGTMEGLRSISSTLAQSGTTSFLATTMTVSLEDIHKSLQAIKVLRDEGCPGAQLLGAHLEGPFISGAAIGAQNPDFLQLPSIETYQAMTAGCEDVPKCITLACELPGSDTLIPFLAETGIRVSIGHSQATYEEVVHAVDLGASHSTHLFNGMSGLHHRKPGIVGATFDLDAMTTEVIADGIHIVWPVLRITFKQKSTDKVLLISDAMMACGMPDGDYSLGGQAVVVAHGAAHLKTGSLAGSVLTLREAIKNVTGHCNVPLYEAVKMATLNPARYCGVDDHKGQIALGYDADLVLFDDDLTIHKVIIGGRILP